MSLIMIAFILLNNILFNNSQLFKNICFTIIGEPEKNILMMFNDLLPFIPNQLEIIAVTKEYKNTSLISILSRTRYFLQKESSSCSDPLIYQIPQSSVSILIINFTLSFGNQGIVLDEFQAAMKPDFIESEHIFDGLLGNTRIKVRLKHEYSNQSTLIERSHSHPHLSWRRRLRKILPGESYCLRLFTTEFSKPFIFSKYPSYGNKTFVFYKFIVSTFGYMIPYQLQKKTYLGNVYPCASSTPSEEILKIYVCPSTITISFEISETDYGYSNSVQYTKKYDKFIIDTISPSFEFDKLQIIYKYLQQYMVENKYGMFIYREKIKRKFCHEYIPEFLINYQLSFIDEYKVGKVILKRNYRYLDQITSELRIYKITVSFTSDMEKCLK